MKQLIKKIFLLMCLIFILFGTTGCFRIINDGEVGVKKTLGNYKDEELRTGFKVFIPVISLIYKVNTKLITIEEKISVPSKEGLMVDLDVSVIYSVREDMASEIKQTVTGDIKDTLLVPYMRNGVRDIVSGYEAKAVYSEVGRGEIAQKLKAMLMDKIGDRLIIKDTLLRDVVLPAKVRNAIEEKIDAEQKAQKKEFELLSAKKDAEIDVARARGVAESNKIISDSITPEYLKWKFIEALSIAGADVIYVPTEANLPVMEAMRFGNLDSSDSGWEGDYGTEVNSTS